MSNFKDTLFNVALKVMNNPTAQKIMSNETVQNTVGSAIGAGFTLKEKVDQTKKKIAGSFGLSTTDDLRDLKREVDRLQRQVDHLKEEKDQDE